MSCLSECYLFHQIRDTFNSCWPAPFLHAATQWLGAASRSDRRKYFRTLIPLSLFDALLDSVRDADNKKELVHNAITERAKSLLASLSALMTAIRALPYPAMVRLHQVGYDRWGPSPAPPPPPPRTYKRPPPPPTRVLPPKPKKRKKK